MAKNFDTEIREAYGKKYLKVFLKDVSILYNVAAKLKELDSVKTANVTENTRPDITVYPNEFSSIEEVQSEVIAYLESYFSGKPILLQEPQIKETISLLDKYPDVKKLCDEAIGKYQKKVYQRNTLDDMRLALELLLKHVFNNEKSLENQKSEVGKLCASNGGSKEFSNMFMTLVDYYGKYQDEHIKHNDDVKSQEVDAIINLTMIFMRSFMSMIR